MTKETTKKVFSIKGTKNPPQYCKKYFPKDLPVDSITTQRRSFGSGTDPIYKTDFSVHWSATKQEWVAILTPDYIRSGDMILAITKDNETVYDNKNLLWRIEDLMKFWSACKLAGSIGFDIQSCFKECLIDLPEKYID